MQKDTNVKLKELQKKAMQRKLSCPNAKSDIDVQKEQEHFEHIKEKLYHQIVR